MAFVGADRVGTEIRVIGGGMDMTVTLVELEETGADFLRFRAKESGNSGFYFTSRVDGYMSVESREWGVVLAGEQYQVGWTTKVKRFLFLRRMRWAKVFFPLGDWKRPEVMANPFSTIIQS